MGEIDSAHLDKLVQVVDSLKSTCVRDKQPAIKTFNAHTASTQEIIHGEWREKLRRVAARKLTDIPGVLVAHREMQPAVPKERPHLAGVKERQRGGSRENRGKKRQYKRKLVANAVAASMVAPDLPA